MSDPTVADADAQSPVRFQFSLQTVVGLFVVVALLLGYLRLFSVESIVQCTVLTGASLGVGGLVGARARKCGDAMFWSAIGAVFGFLAVLGDAAYHWGLYYVWPLVGGLAGATAAVCPDRQLARRMGWSGLVATVAVAAAMICFVGFQVVMLADLACAALGGALMALGVELAGRFERHTALPRHLLATAFVVVGITGHWLAVNHAKTLSWWVRS